jgi:hypothetical protein
MERTRRMPYTISQWMVVTAAVACVLALVRLGARPGTQVAVEVSIAAGVLLLFLWIGALNWLVESTIGIQCPGCGRWTLHRLARYRQYYRCSVCRARYRRVGLGPWRDASGHDDDVRFQGNVNARTWRGYATPIEPGDTTSGRLLRNKRRRARNGGGAA